LEPELRQRRGAAAALRPHPFQKTGAIAQHKRA
jgi:hypothetical protein